MSHALPSPSTGDQSVGTDSNGIGGLSKGDSNAALDRAVLSPATPEDYPAISDLVNYAYRGRAPSTVSAGPERCGQSEPNGNGNDDATRATPTPVTWAIEDCVTGDRMTAELLAEELEAAPDATLFVWRDAVGERPAGMGTGIKGCFKLEPPHPPTETTSTDAHDQTWHLGLLAVDPLRQNQQLGRRLIVGAEDLVRARGGAAVSLHVVHVRDTLIEWYERRGFVRTGATVEFPYHDERIGEGTRRDLYFVELVKRL